MNIDKVNATLGKALIFIQEGEAEDLRGVVAESDEETGPFDEWFDDLVDDLTEATGLDDEQIVEAISEVAGGLVEEHGKVTIESQQDLVDWAEKVELVKAVGERLAS